MTDLTKAREVAQRLRTNLWGADPKEAADTIEQLIAEVETLRDSCAAKADRIDRLGETVERLTKLDVEPVYQLFRSADEMWRDVSQDSYKYNLTHDNEVRVVYPASALAAEQAKVRELVDALHSISLASQDSGSTREGMGLYARAAIAKYGELK